MSARPHSRGAPAPGPTAAVDPAAAVECRDVHKRYRSTVALQGVSLVVPRGSVFGLLGPNGAGKSTLVKILTGLVHADSGSVTVLGGRPGSRTAQQGLGYLPEHFRFPGWLTARELLLFHGRLLGVTVDTRRLLGLVGLGDAGERRVADLSKGMQQRLGLAQALVGEPALVFLDEPTSALDPLGRIDVRDVLLHLKERGVTVFLNSHLLTEVEKICDRVAVIDRGSVIAQGSIDDLLQGPVARIEVGELTPDQAASALAALRALSASAARFDTGAISVAVASRDDLPRVVATLVGLGIPVYEAGLARRSLEDAFVKLVREHEPAPHTTARRPAVDDVAVREART